VRRLIAYYTYINDIEQVTRAMDNDLDLKFLAIGDSGVGKVNNSIGFSSLFV